MTRLGVNFFQGKTKDEECRIRISLKDKITVLGSCLCDSFGQMLADCGFDVCVNPFGALYNPLSILHSIERLDSGKEFTEDDCIRIGAGDERYCSFNHYTAFARETREEFLSQANAALAEAAEHFRLSNKLIIAVGTSWCYRHIERDFIVSNCLKRPASEFERLRLSVDEVRDALEKMLETSGKEIIFMLCPIRHFKDGAHQNQLSKATLRLAVQECLDAYSRTDYFPAYEILMDELRDYRFYAEDMCHLTNQTTNYLKERFINWALPANERNELEENIRQHKRNCHRPHCQNP